MADAITTITILHQHGTDPASLADELILDTSARSAAVQRASAKLAAIAGGIEGGTVGVRVDSALGKAASGTVVCTQADLAAGDLLHFFVPGYAAPFTLTAVASSPTAADGEFSIETSDDAVGDSLEAAISALAGLREHVTASNASGTVTVTAKRVGSAGNSIKMAAVLDTAGSLALTQLSGGLEISAKPSMTVTFGSADIAADDTISIGARKYTWKASAILDGEITLSTTEATAAANFAAAVNADATWTGLITASADGTVVTLTWEGDPRLGQHVVMDFAETNSGSVALGGTAVIGSGEAFTLGTTVTGSSATKRYQIGGP